VANTQWQVHVPVRDGRLHFAESLVVNLKILQCFIQEWWIIMFDIVLHPRPPKKTVCVQQIASQFRENASRNLPRIKTQKIEQKSTIHYDFLSSAVDTMWKTFSILTVLCASTLSHRKCLCLNVAVRVFCGVRWKCLQRLITGLWLFPYGHFSPDTASFVCLFAVPDTEVIAEEQEN